MKDLAFYLGLGSLFTHELDAVLNHEWRVLPLISRLPDDLGMFVFVAAHVPLFAAIIALTASLNAKTRSNTRLGVCIFLLLHALLHGLFMNHPNYEFSSTLSNFLIFGGGLLGAVYLVEVARGR